MTQLRWPRGRAALLLLVPPGRRAETLVVHLNFTGALAPHAPKGCTALQKETVQV